MRYASAPPPDRLVLLLSRMPMSIGHFPSGCTEGSDPTLPHGRRDPPALIVGWYNLRHIFPQGGRRTTLQGGFRKEVGRKNVTFGHYIPIQYIIRKYALSTIYCYCSRMGGGKLQLLFLRAAGHNLRTCSKHRTHHRFYYAQPSYRSKADSASFYTLCLS